MLRAASRRRAELTIALLSALPLLPALPQPFLQDDINSTYQAAITTSRPLHLLDPWMGGLLRLVPKLYFVLIMLVAGPIPWV
ncbi:MAG TPA: hypothetical protein VKF80_08365, partial [Candidatus Eisenbacteria bacterium]|nr:hypothetical protein [Candidatus Eisenbacteria bacterium]